MASLSVITLALNEEHNIAGCLKSVRWADEIIVIDSGSTDKTVELAKQFTDKVWTVPWKGYGTTKNLALERAAGEWILWLDADERVPEGLADEIRTVVRNDEQRYAGYTVARRAFFLGRWIKHCGWYPGRVTRLFRKNRSRFTEAQVHEQILVEGEIGNLEHDLLHYTDPDLQHYFSKFNRYTSLAAQDMKAAGKSASLLDLLIRPPFMFFKMYVIRLGLLDGVEGFILCVVSSAYVFAKYAKLMELGKTRQLNKSAPLP